MIMDNLNDLKRNKMTMTRGCIPLLTAIMVFSLLAAMPRTANAANITWDGTDLTVANGDVVTLNDAAWIGGGTLTVPASSTVDIFGTVMNATNGITIDFGDALSRVYWYATYETAASFGGNVITLTGSAAWFGINNCWIIASGNDGAVFSGAGGPKVYAGTTAMVSATGGTAIKADLVELDNCTVSATTGIAIDAGQIYNTSLTHIAAPPPKNHKKQSKFSYFQAIFVS